MMLGRLSVLLGAVMVLGSEAPAQRPPAMQADRALVVAERPLGKGDAATAEAGPPRELRNSFGMDFVRIEPGTFEMGSPTTEPGRFADETLHTVTLTQPFYLGKTEVTQEQWAAVMGTQPSEFSTCGRRCPVESVSWAAAQAFIAALNQREGVTVYRLPTEAEWEYAARAGTQTAYPFGTAAAQLGAYAWYVANAESQPHPVGQKRPNAWGLYDMLGNVAEWVQDGHEDYPTGAVTDPRAPATGSFQVIRGGGWRSPARGCRAAFRHYAVVESYSRLGVRLARSP